MTQALGILVAVAIVLGLLYILRHPEFAIILVIMQFPLEQLLQSYIPLVNTSWIWNVTTGVVAASAAGVAFFRGENVFRGYFNRVMALSAGLYLIAVIGLIWTPAPDTAMSFIGSHWPYLILKLFIAPLLIRDMESLRRIMVPLMFIGVTIAILVMVNPASSYHGGRLRLDLGMYDSSGGNPLEIGSLGATCALIAVLYRPAKATGIINLLRIATFVIGLGLAIGSGSRGQVLAAMIAGVAFFPIARKLENPKQFFLTMIGIGFLGLGFIIVSKLFIVDENRERWDLLEMIADIGNRFDMVWALLAVYLESPGSWLFGLGPSAFMTIGIGGDAKYVHNIYAEALCEEGIVGFSFLMLTIFFAARYGKQIFEIYRHDPAYRSAFTVMIAILLYQMLLSGKQGSLLGFPPMFMWMILMAKISITEAKLVAEGVVIPALPDHEYEYDDEYEDDEGQELDYGTPAIDGGGAV